MKDIPVERIVKIDPEGKYILLFPERIEPEVMNDAAEFLTEWWNDDSRPFCIVGDGATVFRLEK